MKLSRRQLIRESVATGYPLRIGAGAMDDARTECSDVTENWATSATNSGYH